MSGKMIFCTHISENGERCYARAENTELCSMHLEATAQEKCTKCCAPVRDAYHCVCDSTCIACRDCLNTYPRYFGDWIQVIEGTYLCMDCNQYAVRVYFA